MLKPEAIRIVAQNDDSYRTALEATWGVWQSDSLTVSQSHSLTVWQSHSLTVWQSERSSDILIFRSCDSLQVTVLFRKRVKSLGVAELRHVQFTTQTGGVGWEEEEGERGTRSLRSVDREGVAGNLDVVCTRELEGPWVVAVSTVVATTTGVDCLFQL
jgi:hypothetical protein